MKSLGVILLLQVRSPLLWSPWKLPTFPPIFLNKIVCIPSGGENHNLKEQYFHGDIELELVPQGSLAKNSELQEQESLLFLQGQKFEALLEKEVSSKSSDTDDGIEKVSIGKEMRIFNCKRYFMVHSIQSDYAFIKENVADELGNVTFNKTDLNFNIDIAKSTKNCTVEVEKIVPAGTIDPHNVQLPHIYVKRLIKGTNYIKSIEKYTNKKEGENATEADIFKTSEWKIKKKITERAVKMVKDEMYINLSIGDPVLIANFIDKSLHVTFQSENGILGLGEFP